MRARTVKRALLFLGVAALSAHVLVASAQPKRGRRPKPRPKPAVTLDAGAAASQAPSREAGAAKAPAGAAAPPKEPAASAKTVDGGTRVFRFGEVEVEGRLKSPQIVYFLRRVRAEFAAADLGHRSFMLELKDTRNDPPF